MKLAPVPAATEPRPAAAARPGKETDPREVHFAAALVSALHLAPAAGPAPPLPAAGATTPPPAKAGKHADVAHSADAAVASQDKATPGAESHAEPEPAAMPGARAAPHTDAKALAVTVDAPALDAAPLDPAMRRPADTPASPARARGASPEREGAARRVSPGRAAATARTQGEPAGDPDAPASHRSTESAASEGSAASRSSRPGGGHASVALHAARIPVAVGTGAAAAAPTLVGARGLATDSAERTTFDKTGTPDASTPAQGTDATGGGATRGRIERVTVPFEDSLGGVGRLRVVRRGEQVRATIVTEDTDLARKLDAHLVDLRGKLAERGLGDAQLSVWNPRSEANAKDRDARARRDAQDPPARDGQPRKGGDGSGRKGRTT